MSRRAEAGRGRAGRALPWAAGLLAVLGLGAWLLDEERGGPRLAHPAVVPPAARGLAAVGPGVGRGPDLSATAAEPLLPAPLERPPALHTSSAAGANALQSVHGVVVGVGNEPVAGARVRALSGAAGLDLLADLLGGGPARPLPETQATADGSFRLALEALPPDGSRIYLVVDAPTHGVGLRRIDPDGQAVVDAGRIRLLRGVTVAGRIVDDRGRALPGAEFRPSLSAARNGAWGWGPTEPVGGALIGHALAQELLVGRAGADGRFVLAGVPEDSAEFSLSDGRAGPFVVGPMKLDDAGDAAIDLGDLVLPLSRRLAGVVRARDGGPVAGARIHVDGNPPSHGGSVPGEEDLLAVVAARRLPSAVADDEGRFVLAGLPAPVYALTVVAQGFTVARHEHLAVGREDLELVLDPAPPWRVLVCGPDGAPLAEATLRAGPSDQLRVSAFLARRPFQQDRATVLPQGAPGRFEVRGAGPGTLLLTAGGPGLASRILAGHTLPVDDTGLRRFTLYTPCRVWGQVSTGPERRGVAGAVVALDPSTDLDVTGLSLTVRTDAEGRYAIEGLPAGTWHYGVVAEGFLPHGSMRSGAPSELVTSAAEPDLRFDVRLHRSGSIEGRALAHDGQPLALEPLSLRRVTAAGEFEHGGLRAGPQGEFAFADLPAGTYAVSGKAGGKARVDVAPGAPTWVELLSPVPARIRGVVWSGATPVPHAEVLLLTNIPDPTEVGGLHRFSQTALTDGDGRFEKLTAKAGDMQISVRRGKHLVGEPVSLRVSSGGDYAVELRVPATRVSGRVVDGLTGLGVAGALVAIDGEPGGSVGIKTATDGGFQVLGLESGAWSASASEGKRRLAAPVPLRLEPDSAVVLPDLVLSARPPGATLTGTLVTASGVPAYDGTAVQLIRVEPGESSEGQAQRGWDFGGVGAQTRDGAFRFSDVEAGTWRLSVTETVRVAHERFQLVPLVEHVLTLQAGETRHVALVLAELDPAALPPPPEPPSGSVIKRLEQLGYLGDG